MDVAIIALGGFALIGWIFYLGFTTSRGPSTTDRIIDSWSEPTWGCPRCGAEGEEASR